MRAALQEDLALPDEAPEGQETDSEASSDSGSVGDQLCLEDEGEDAEAPADVQRGRNDKYVWWNQRNKRYEVGLTVSGIRMRMYAKTGTPLEDAVEWIAWLVKVRQRTLAGVREQGGLLAAFEKVVSDAETERRESPVLKAMPAVQFIPNMGTWNGSSTSSAREAAEIRMAYDDARKRRQLSNRSDCWSARFC